MAMSVMTPCSVVSFSKMLLPVSQNTRRYNQDNGNKLINMSSTVFYLFTPPMKMEHTHRSAHNIQMLENHPAFTTRRKFEIKSLEHCLFICFVLFDCYDCCLSEQHFIAVPDMLQSIKPCTMCLC